MFPSKIILDLITSVKKGDSSQFDESLKELVVLAEKKGNHKVAKDLRILYSQPTQSLTSNDNVVASSLTEVKNDLFEIRKSTVTLKDIVLSKNNTKSIQDVLDYYKSRHVLIENKIPVDNKVLLYGPPGSGKTMLAYVIAGELDLPVIHVNLDMLISSYLGETGKNIKLIFDQVLNYQGILFLDEFDTIAKHRDDSNELGELKRVVTVLLQNIDRLDSSVIMVAATNHEHLLDSAIWRRFDHQLHIDYLDKEPREVVLKMYLSKYLENVDLKTLTALSEGMSNALLKQLIHKSIGQYVLKNREIDLNNLLQISFATTSISERRRTGEGKYKKEQMKPIIDTLRNTDQKVFTYEHLATITGIPSSTIHNWYK